MKTMEYWNHPQLETMLYEKSWEEKTPSVFFLGVQWPIWETNTCATTLYNSFYFANEKTKWGIDYVTDNVHHGRGGQSGR